LGTGKLALEGGLHPAQLKDSVTSMSIILSAGYPLTNSPWWMHDSRSPDPGGRSSEINNGKSDPGGFQPVSSFSGCGISPSVRPSVRLTQQCRGIRTGQKAMNIVSIKGIRVDCMHMLCCPFTHWLGCRNESYFGCGGVDIP